LLKIRAIVIDIQAWCNPAPVLACLRRTAIRRSAEKIMIARALVGFAFVAALVLTQSAAWAECAGHAKTVSTAAPATPVQTAEAPTSTKSK
jgi:hypothetical protein